jgi:hypothetical protein
MAPMVVDSPSTTAGIQFAPMTAREAMGGDGLPAGDHLSEGGRLVLIGSMGRG